MTNPYDMAIEAACEEFWGNNWKNGNARDPELVEAMRAAIAAYERAMWRPIEEAPLSSECEKVLIIGGRYEHITVKLSDGEWWKSQKGKIAGIPTHFRPFPPVPEGE